jgi:hypothetical protein
MTRTTIAQVTLRPPATALPTPCYRYTTAMVTTPATAMRPPTTGLCTFPPHTPQALARILPGFATGCAGAPLRSQTLSIGSCDDR